MPPNPDETFAVTLGEVWRTVQKMDETLSALVRGDRADVVAALVTRVDKLEAWQTYALRVVVGAVLAAVLVAVGLVGASSGTPAP